MDLEFPIMIKEIQGMFSSHLVFAFFLEETGKNKKGRGVMVCCIFSHHELIICNYFVFYAGLNVGELSRTSCLLASGNVMSLLRDIRMVGIYRSEMELEMLGQIIFR